MCDNMAVGVGLVHDEKNQSVSVGLDASAAGSNSTTSTHQTSCLFTAGQVTYSAFSKTVLKQQLSLPGKIFTVQPLQMAHALEIKFWVISSVCHNLFFNKKKKEKASRSFASIHLYKVQVHESQRVKQAPKEILIASKLSSTENKQNKEIT